MNTVKNLLAWTVALIVLVGTPTAILVLGTAPADAAKADDGVFIKCVKDGVARIEVRTSSPRTVTIYGIGDKSVTARVKGSLFLRTDSNLYGVYFKGQQIVPRDPMRNPCIVTRKG